MGKVKEACQDFLDEGGFALGYSMDYLPSINDFMHVLSNNIDAQQYSETIKAYNKIKKENHDK